MTRKAFDPVDGFDAMSENFRRAVSDLALNADAITIYRELSPRQQLECFMCGVVTGLVGVCFGSIKPEGRDQMMKAIAAYLPQARQQVEAMLEKIQP